MNAYFSAIYSLRVNGGGVFLSACVCVWALLFDFFFHLCFFTFFVVFVQELNSVSKSLKKIMVVVVFFMFLLLSWIYECFRMKVRGVQRCALIINLYQRFGNYDILYWNICLRTTKVRNKSFFQLSQWLKIEMIWGYALYIIVPLYYI